MQEKPRNYKYSLKHRHSLRLIYNIHLPMNKLLKKICSTKHFSKELISTAEKDKMWMCQANLAASTCSCTAHAVNAGELHLKLKEIIYKVEM